MDVHQRPVPLGLLFAKAATVACVPEFDQASYWSTRGDRYKEEFAGHSGETTKVFERQERTLENLLGRHDLSDVKGLLEIGCGFGRLTPILLRRLPNLERYVGVDVSSGQITAAKEAFPSGVEAEFVVADFRTADLNGPFDLVFAGEVFLHFPPEQVEKVVRKALRLGRTLIHLDPFRPRPRIGFRLRAAWTVDHLRRGAPLRSTDWTHDYPRFYLDRQVTIHPVLEGIQHLFVVEDVSMAGTE